MISNPYKAVLNKKGQNCIAFNCGGGYWAVANDTVYGSKQEAVDAALEASFISNRAVSAQSSCLGGLK